MQKIDNVPTLMGRFDRAWYGVQGQKFVADQTRQRLIYAYSRPGRYYHNLRHIRQCLEEVDETISPSLNNHLELAIWFHDIVYDVRRNDNEEKSANLAYSILVEGGVNERDAAIIRSLIRVTKTYEVPMEMPRDVAAAARFLCDVDLSILGKDPATYDAYTKVIRKEYSHVWQPLYVYGRKKVLKRLLHKIPLYYTPYFSQKYGAQARLNMKAEIKKLSIFKRYC